jgi:succinate dehydrogenase/fumarate reductase flavoprotein subunit
MQSDRGFTRYDTDVLVIGGGLAALRAALSARQAGARVLVAVKRRLARSGSSANTTGGFAAAIADLNPFDNPQLHYRDTIVGGGHINDRTLVRRLCQEAPARLAELWQLGAAFRRRDGRYHVSPSGDHSQPRVFVPENMRGTDMTAPLREAVIAAGVEVLENVAIVELLGDGERVVGALGIARDRIEGIVITAGATVLAAGGAGRLFTITSNPVDVCGGGFALALRAGARLRDMEFIQFYPWRLIRPFKSTRVPIQPSTFVLGARLLNSRGERFMECYDPIRKDAAMRDVSARAIFDQIRHGLAVEGGVRLDVSAVADEQFRYENSRVVELLDGRGIDYRQIELVVAPEAHFFMGGVVIDEEARSNVAGLYAAGENAGGVHGGNRLNSNAVPETQVIGHRAGLCAADRAKANIHFDPAPVDAWQRRLEELQQDAAACSPECDSLLEELQAAMTIGIGIVRSADGLRAALARAETIRERAQALPAVGQGDLIARVEICDLCTVAVACAESALMRRESRAAHYREDFPELDPAWQRTIFYSGAGLESRAVAGDPEEADWACLMQQTDRAAASQPGAKEFIE